MILAGRRLVLNYGRNIPTKYEFQSSSQNHPSPQTYCCSTFRIFCRNSTFRGTVLSKEARRPS